MSPVESEVGTELLLHGVGRCCEAISESQSNRSSKADEDSESQTPTPMNPTPPRTRRGSWFFKKSREQRHQNPSIKHQRARSNSVPTVMELSQLSLWQQQMAEQLKQSLIPDIIVSGENTEDDECFTPGQQSSQQRRHRSYDDQLQNFAQSSESLLSDDVVEGFSWTMAETIIEDIMKEIGSKQTQLSLPSRHNPSGGVGKSGPLKMTNKLPGKSILKISSNDSLHRSHSGSLDHQQTPENNMERPTYAIHKTIAEHMAEQQHQNAPMSWSHRSTSMPSLRAIDELESLNTSSIIDECDTGQVSAYVITRHERFKKKKEKKSNKCAALSFYSSTNWWRPGILKKKKYFSLFVFTFYSFHFHSPLSVCYAWLLCACKRLLFLTLPTLSVTFKKKILNPLKIRNLKELIHFLLAISLNIDDKWQSAR
jgi:hypothetical protein